MRTLRSVLAGIAALAVAGCLKQDKLVWAGRSQTTNPSKADDFVKELTAGAVREMKKVGLIRSA